jgi:hypothetical protein
MGLVDMTALALSLLWKAWPIAVAFIGWLGARIYYMRAGAAKERAKREAADRMVEDISDQIQNDVRAMSPEQVDAELRKRSRK